MSVSHIQCALHELGVYSQYFLRCSWSAHVFPMVGNVLRVILKSDVLLRASTAWDIIRNLRQVRAALQYTMPKPCDSRAESPEQFSDEEMSSATLN